MPDRSFVKWGGAAAVVGGVVAAIGNLLHPRYSFDDDVRRYKAIAKSTRFTVADVLIIIALIFLIGGLCAFSVALRDGRAGALARFGGLAAAVGGSIAVAQFGIEEYAMRQDIVDFARASKADQYGAFWSTHAIDRINSGLFAAWTVVLLGVAPLLLGVAILTSKRLPVWHGVIAVAGGVLCTAVGFINLLNSDQSSTDAPFLVGSLLVTVWIIASGLSLWRTPEPA